jgi:hypothetical protein
VQYDTTNKRTYVNLIEGANGKEVIGNDRKTQIERMQKMRTQNFIYG